MSLKSDQIEILLSVIQSPSPHARFLLTVSTEVYFFNSLNMQTTMKICFISVTFVHHREI